MGVDLAAVAAAEDAPLVRGPLDGTPRPAGRDVRGVDGGGQGTQGVPLLGRQFVRPPHVDPRRLLSHPRLPVCRRIGGGPEKAQNISVTLPLSRAWASVSTPLPVRSR